MPPSAVSGGVSGNLLQVARSVVATHGAGALYRGFRASLVGDVLGNSLGFTCYEMGNRWGHAQVLARWQGASGAATLCCVGGQRCSRHGSLSPFLLGKLIE
jgi:hypothetical protein